MTIDARAKPVGRTTLSVQTVADWIVRPTRAAALRAMLCLCALLAFSTGACELFAQSSDVREAFEEQADSFGTVSQPELQAEVQSESESTEVLPTPKLEGRLPLAGGGPGEVNLSEKDGRITLVVRDAALSRVVAMLAQTQNLNIVASNDIDALISITLRDVPMEEALTAILSVANYTWVKRNNIILITSLTGATNLPADVQGRQIQVFDLDFASATVVAESVTNFLSPIGKVTVSQSDSANNRLTQERIIVEDLPESLARIAAFICQIDRPPRQVLIEAHVLQVTLDDTCRCGVNFNELLRISNADLTLATRGFANPNAPQAFLATLEGGDLGGVIEALQTTTDTKSLGSPKLLVLNEQEARIQVGETLYYTQTTTTETSSQQGAGSIETGVILRLTPRITRDGRVLMHVAPEVSAAGERETPELPPDTTTTQLETDIMLEDGQGMIIGGLIKENDSVKQAKIPYLGNVKGIGWLFRRSEVTKSRVEIIVALVPRIQPYSPEWQAYEQGELVKAGVPLFHGPLQRTDRPWDAILPDGKRVYYPLVPKKHHRRPTGYYHGLGDQYVIPQEPLPKQSFPDEPCDCPPAPPTSRRHANPFVADEVLPMPDLVDEYQSHGEVISDQQ